MFLKRRVLACLFTIALLCFCTLTFNPISGANSNTVTDIDGNAYHTVAIGTQVWMVENLKTTRYNDGTAIPLVTDSAVWGNLTSTPGYCWYNNDMSMYKNLYGALYNWYAVSTEKLAPEGWHVPTNSEWGVLINYLGGDTSAGGAMKETGSYSLAFAKCWSYQYKWFPSTSSWNT